MPGDGRSSNPSAAPHIGTPARYRRHDRTLQRHTGRVHFPTPDKPERAPVWENYVVAQAAHAALRLIPPYVYAMGVEVEGTSVTLVVQVPPTVPTTDQDIDDIVGELEVLLGREMNVANRVDSCDVYQLRPDDGVRWFYAARE
jgi:hypothetical protein